ncbi:hypothetical protein R3W88_009184 [Solanum pinnatisectum]|uniref:O-methyltransferase n=1 Tax=Solanum pinnatisectum TaxID=50273 RepID=A0AAV9MAP1_9SOLN|nr:hypothetical protein R3W88_009184 [Solanum pinnatisectum]
MTTLPNNDIGENIRQVLAAQAHIWNHIFNFLCSMSLKCAIQLGIPDIIHSHGRAMTLSDLVEALSINKSKGHGCIYRLMRILIHSGFFIQEGEGYLLAPNSHLLLKDEPLSLVPLTIFEYAEKETKINYLLNEAMASDARLIMSVLIQNGKGLLFEGLKSLVDVGGGTGTVAKAIVDAFPQINCIVFDLPHVIEGLEGCKNLSFVGGDMFNFIPSANAILLKENGGMVIIIDMVLMDHNNEKGDDKSYETKLLMDMLMMVLVCGKERSQQEWAKLFFDAGYSDYKIIPILGLRCVIEVYP